MPSHAHKAYEFGHFRLELSDHSLSRNGKLIPLTPKAFEVLVCLIERQGHLVKKDELMQEVWADSFVEEGNIARTIWMLRNALGDDRNGRKYIQTIPKHGYSFVADVSVVERETSALSTENGHHQTPPDSPPTFVNGALENRHRDLGPLAEASKSKDVLRISRVENGYGLVQAVATIPDAELTHSNTERGTQKNLWRRYGLFSLIAVFVLIGVLIVAPFLRKMGARPASPMTSLAVLPFENLTGDPSQEYFSASMTEILNAELATLTNLRVTARSSTIRYKDTQESMQEIANELGVRGVITGTANHVGNHVMVTIHLYRADTGESVWSRTYERDYGDAITLQRTIARSIADEIKIKLSPQEELALSNGGPLKPEAEDHYFRGLFYFREAESSIGKDRDSFFLKCIEELGQAVRIDPDFSKAHSTLAQCNIYLATSDKGDYWQNAKASAEKALQLDETNAGAHGALAIVAWRYEWNLSKAEEEFSRATELDPAAGDMGHPFFALFLSATGRHEEAIVQMKRAEEIDPFSIKLKTNIGNIYLRAKQYDLAIQEFERVLELSPKSTEVYQRMGMALACNGKFAEGIEATRKGMDLLETQKPPLSLAWIYARAGKPKEALEIVNEVISSPLGMESTRNMYELAGVYAELGDKDRAFAWLDKLEKQRSQLAVWLGTDVEFEHLRDDPRFGDILHRIDSSRKYY